MRNIDSRVAEYLKRSRRRSIWKQFVKGMSCVVVFCTVYALILPAITAQTAVFCGIEEHMHTQECYVQARSPQAGTLVCSPESLGVHVHQDACYDAEGKRNCGQADYLVHNHDAFCYDAEGNLICLLEERSQHVHDDSCYQAVVKEPQPTEPVVTEPVQTESVQTEPPQTQPPMEPVPTDPEHVHTEDCYTIERGQLICMLEETGHVHDETCAVVGETLSCQLAETEGHTHGEECVQRTLICAAAAAEIHEHGPECYQTNQICPLAETEGHIHSDSCWGQNQICGQEESENHTHDDSCFQAVLQCGMEETEPHTHSEGCFEQVLICQVASVAEDHVHDESCYQTTVLCELPEQEAHTHGEGCYEAAYSCGLLETEGHIHTDECYEQVEVLTCPEGEASETEPTEAPETQPTEPVVEEPVPNEQPETEPVPTETEPETELVLICTEPVAMEHVHSDECFATEELPLTCGLEENEEHTHSELCYGTWELVCEMEEHTHATACYSDPTADVETAEDWEETFSQVEFTGDWAKDVLAIARTQLGYTESEKNYIVLEDGTVNGYTRYGEWYGDHYGDWCAMFASFCISYAEVENMPLESNCILWIEDLEHMGLYHDADVYQPKPADLIFFDWGEDNDVDHVGLVHELIPATDGEVAKIQTIEGNSANCVQYVTYPLDDGRIMGYGALPQRQVESYPCGLEAHSHDDGCYGTNGELVCGKPEHIHSAECTERKLYYSDEMLSAFVTISGVEELPEGLTLQVWQITPEENPELYGSMEVAVSAEMSTDSRFVSNTAIFQTELLLDGEPYTLPEEAKVNVEVKFNDPVFTRQDVEDAVDMQTYVVTPDPEAVVPEEEAGQEPEATEPQVQEQASTFSLRSSGGAVASTTNAPEDNTEPVTDGTNTEVYQAEVPEEEKIENPDQGVTGVTIKANRLGAVAVALATETQTGDFWTRVTSPSELAAGGTFMIVSAEGNYALRGDNSNTHVAVTVQTVKANEEYYTISDNTNENIPTYLKWTFTGSGSSYTIKNQNNNYLYMDSVGSWFNSKDYLIYSSSKSLTLSYVTPENCWRIANGSDYLRNTGAGAFTYGSGNDGSGNPIGTLYGSETYYYSRDMLIFKQVNTTLTIPDDVEADAEGGGSTQVAPSKPDYGEFTTPTGALYGDTAVVDKNDATIKVSGQYFSDPSTTDIENEFRENTYAENETNDGKVLTDKSVIYGDDDYNAFSDYPANTFGVTLSALGQEYKLPEQDTVRTPVDVVFVLDVSGSMYTNETKNSGERRIEALADALNEAMGHIMDDHVANRVGIALYSSGAWELLPLDRYTANDTDSDGSRNYIDLKQYTQPYSGERLYVVGGSTLKTESGSTVYQGKGDQSLGYQGIGTYTQAGLAMGRKIFHDIGSDTKYTTTINSGDSKKEVTVTRQPVIILLSDGEPTHCTNIYMDALNGPHYGDGNGNVDEGNVSGIQGYYTILTANYVKRMVGIHYQKKAMFFTIGLGIKEPDAEDDDTPYPSLNNTAPGTGDRYKRTVLNPTAENIANMSTSINSADTVELLRDLLNGAIDDQAVQTRSKWPDPWTGIPHVYTPVLHDNPYSSNYSYADQAYFGKMSKEELAKIFSQIISDTQQDTPYGFILYRNSSVELQDNIGVGMEVKGTPVLRYGGMNYREPTVTVNGDVTTYTYSGTFTDPYIPDRTMDLSQIIVTVTTNADNTQTVDMFVPDTVLPTYTPELIGGQFYYESLPVRLIYQVGLTEEAEQKVLALQKTGGKLTFYTNKWEQDSDVAISTLLPSDANPFYFKVDDVEPPYEPHHTDKSENTTGTLGYVVDCNKSNRAEDNRLVVIHKLGNNGKLVFEADTVSIPVEKQWAGIGESARTDVNVTLYRVVETTTEAGTTNTKVEAIASGIITEANNWTYTFTGVPAPGTDWYYAIVESLVPGTQPQYSGQTVSIPIDNGAPVLAAKVDFTNPDGVKVIITNVPGVELPSTGGAGTTLYTTGGLLIMIVSAAILLYSNKPKRRKEAQLS